jgi:hypothetical protein
MKSAGMIAAATVTQPFPGLRPFTAQESALFFGRDEQVEGKCCSIAEMNVPPPGEVFWWFV